VFIFIIQSMHVLEKDCEKSKRKERKAVKESLDMEHALLESKDLLEQTESKLMYVNVEKESLTKLMAT
jgi:hypothetical protein